MTRPHVEARLSAIRATIVALDALGIEPRPTLIAQRLEGTVHQVTRQTVAADLRRLLDAGLVERDGDVWSVAAELDSDERAELRRIAEAIEAHA